MKPNQSVSMKQAGVFAAGALLTAITSMANITPSPLFSDHMVLQRGEPVPVWGTAEPGETVEVIFRGKKAATKANSEGNWQLFVDPGSAGGPFELTIRGNDEIRIKDVMVGEVWLCSGQSNMQWLLRSNIINSEAEIAKADYPLLRQFMVNNVTSEEPLQTLSGEWTVSSPETAPWMTAVGFFFGKELMQNLNVPIGLINSSWGGTPAEAWTSKKTVSRFPRHAETLSKPPVKRDTPEIYGKKIDQWAIQNDPGSSAENNWAQLGTDTKEWQQLHVPGYWETQDIRGFNGIAWYRKTFELPREWQNKDLVLLLGAVDDFDTTWINGQKIGFTNSYRPERVYNIPASMIKTGTNTIAVRVLDLAGNGGIHTPDNPERFPMLHPAGDSDSAISLAGKWAFRTSTPQDQLTTLPSQPPGPEQRPAAIYNAMIQPLMPFPIRGVIWYQGESNASHSSEYSELFPAMVKDWRKRWNIGDFPFLYVQIAPNNRMPPEIREAQLLSLDKIPNSAMVVTIDVGDADNIHPANKGPVGARLALAARALAYGENITFSGPLYQSMTTSGNKATLRFTSVGPGMVVGGDYLKGFTIAGPDGIFHPATARIEGDTVIVKSPSVEKPTAVRYGWANVAEGNLFNKAGLPASPFRTDVK